MKKSTKKVTHLEQRLISQLDSTETTAEQTVEHVLYLRYTPSTQTLHFEVKEIRRKFSPLSIAYRTKLRVSLEGISSYAFNSTEEGEYDLSQGELISGVFQALISHCCNHSFIAMATWINPVKQLGEAMDAIYKKLQR